MIDCIDAPAIYRIVQFYDLPVTSNPMVTAWQLYPATAVKKIATVVGYFRRYENQ